MADNQDTPTEAPTASRDASATFLRRRNEDRQIAIALPVGVRVSMPISCRQTCGLCGSVAAGAHTAGQEATCYWLSRQRWNRATLLTTTAYGFRAIISA
jgi:hypothetical protein